MSRIEELQQEAIQLLQDLINTPSLSSEEDQTAAIIKQWLAKHGVSCQQQQNNVYAVNKHEDPSKPYLLLNSHHDTVLPNSGYTRDPYKAAIENGKLYGLGSNDAGGALVCLLATFVYFYEQEDMAYNLVVAATAEEETSGDHGLNSLLKTLPNIDTAIVGEPTQMHLAVAEKGLVVFDATISGTASHAAHPNEDNPIYKIGAVINWFQQLKFDRVSDALGPVKLTVTQVNAGKQHNAVPADVALVIDVRVNDLYTNQEIEAILQEAPCTIKARSLRLGSSSIPMEHALVQAGISAGRNTYGSPTLSDQAALSCHSLKLGPGDSLRSHTADEFIYVKEIEEAIPLYISILKQAL
jgi:acetylornithine deacetylase|tara:strand:- start:10 stop:1071 length:1062 start_codon:yes stop_codon:yes gene_type:complete